MGKLDMQTIIKYAAIAFAAYIVWEKIISPMMAGDGETPAVGAGNGANPPATGAGAGSGAGSPPPAGPAHTAPPVSIVPGEQQKLATALQTKAGVALLNVDGWNYYLRELNPNAVVTDLSEVNVKREDKMNVAQYLALRTQAKLTDGTIPDAGGGGLHGFFVN